MYAKLIIVGNLGQEPVMRYLPDGTPVTNFSVAVNRRWNNADGSPGEETLWFRCTAWRKTAEVVNQYLSKGRQVLVEGRLRPDPDTGGPRTFVRNDGSPGAAYEVTVETIKFLGSAPGNNGSQAETPVPVDEDSIPF
jgi:single-strand DNA-binding protein